MARARREAARELSFLLPEAATIKSRREEWETGGDFLVYLLVVETLEDIAQPAASTREKQEDGYDQSHSQGQDQEKTPEDGAWQAVCI